MQYKLIGNNDTTNITKTILNNRGIENWEEYINIFQAPRDTYNNLTNLQEAVELFDMHFQAQDPIGILMDNDVDGVTSATLMYKYIKSLDCNYDVEVYVHQKNNLMMLVSDLKRLLET